MILDLTGFPLQGNINNIYQIMAVNNRNLVDFKEEYVVDILSNIIDDFRDIYEQGRAISIEFPQDISVPQEYVNETISELTKLYNVLGLEVPCWDYFEENILNDNLTWSDYLPLQELINMKQEPAELFLALFVRYIITLNN